MKRRRSSVVMRAALLSLATVGCDNRAVGGAVVSSAYDPLAYAAGRGRAVNNLEAGVPPQCYTKTDATHNPCWVCHTSVHDLNLLGDVALQFEYAFSEQAQKNQWAHLFELPRLVGSNLEADYVLAYVRTDNYSALRQAFVGRTRYFGYKPELDWNLGFDEDGFAKDGTEWRALRYKPFPGVFWPSNGSTDDVLIRLPRAFRELDGKPDRGIYKANLAVLEAAFAADPKLASDALNWPIEAVDEARLGFDLDGSGSLDARVQRLHVLPKHYFGDAREHLVRRAIFPQQTEFLHSVRYLDPDAPGMTARRMKELRYSRKINELSESALVSAYADEAEEKMRGRIPNFQGDSTVGLRNDFGWLFQGFIEDGEGRLRLQTDEEHRACMGCHGALGVTIDSTFAFARKVPGAAGFRYQDLRGIPDVPQLGHDRGEILTYFERNGAGDEFRENTELVKRWAPAGKVDASALKRAAPGGDRDVYDLLAPSRERAIDLNRAYIALVRAQRFELGRDVFLAPAKNVHRTAPQGSTGLAENGKVYSDGQLRLDWSGAKL